MNKEYKIDVESGSLSISQFREKGKITFVLMAIYPEKDVAIVTSEINRNIPSHPSLDTIHDVEKLKEISSSYSDITAKLTDMIVVIKQEILNADEARK